MTIDGRRLKALAAKLADDDLVYIHDLSRSSIREACRMYVVQAGDDNVPTDADDNATPVGSVVITG